MVTQVEHPRAGSMTTLGAPIKLSASPATVRRPAPLLGQHTRAVLAEAGLDENEIGSLIEIGVAEE